MKSALATLCLLLVAFLANLSPTEAQSSLEYDLPQGIRDALTKGDSRTLSAYFNTNVELVVLAYEDVCSKAQAQLILENFFNQHKPVAYNELRGGGSDAAKYSIGELQTEAGSFRIYFLIKIVGDRMTINQMTVEEAPG